MPTVIDSLIVELGLDPSKFTQEQKDVLSSLANFRDKTRRIATEAENNLKSIADGFESLVRKAVAFAGSYLTIRSAVSFGRDIVETNRKMGIMADVMQENIQRLSTLGNVFDRLGGSGSKVLDVIDDWEKQARAIDASLLDPNSSKFVQLFNNMRGIGIDVAQREGNRWRHGVDMFIELSEKIAESGKSRDLIIGMLRDSGMDEETIATVLQYGPVMRDEIKRQQDVLKTTQEQREKTDKLNREMITLGQKLKSMGQDALIFFADSLDKVTDAMKRMFNFLSTQFSDPKSFLYLPSLGEIQEYFKTGGRGGAETGVDADERQRSKATSGTRSGPTSSDPRRTGIEDTSQSGANYMQGKPFNEATDTTVVQTPYGPIKVHKDAATDYKNFYDYLNRHGAPLKRLGSFNDRPKRWGGGKSMHGYGIATDLDDQLYLSKEMRQWIIDNPDKWRQALKESRMRWGGDWKSVYDPGHVEWAGPDGRPNNQEGGGWPRTVAPAIMPFPGFKSPIQLQSPPVQNNTKTEINSVNVNSQASDPTAIASDIAAELKKQMRDSLPSQQLINAKTPEQANAAMLAAEKARTAAEAP